MIEEVSNGGTSATVMTSTVLSFTLRIQREKIRLGPSFELILQSLKMLSNLLIGWTILILRRGFLLLLLLAGAAPLAAWGRYGIRLVVEKLGSNLPLTATQTRAIANNFGRTNRGSSGKRSPVSGGRGGRMIPNRAEDTIHVARGHPWNWGPRGR